MSRAGKFFVILVIWIFGSGGPSSAPGLERDPEHSPLGGPGPHPGRDRYDRGCLLYRRKGERQIAVDLDATSLPPNLPRLTVLNKPGVEGIVLSARPRSGVRVELSLPGPSRPTFSN